MSQVRDLDAKVMCSVSGLVKEQRQFCEGYPDIAISVGKGTKLGITECKKQLKMELWNCSTISRDVSVFGKVLRKGKEIFLIAVMVVQREKIVRNVKRRIYLVRMMVKNV